MKIVNRLFNTGSYIWRRFFMFFYYKLVKGLLNLIIDLEFESVLKSFLQLNIWKN